MRSLPVPDARVYTSSGDGAENRPIPSANPDSIITGKLSVSAKRPNKGSKINPAYRSRNSHL